MTAPAIYGFHGPAGSGKDTAGHYLVNRYGFVRLSFATPMYEMLQAMGLGWPESQAEKEEIIPDLGFTWRHAAQTLGTEWGRKLLRDDIWLMLAQRQIDKNPGTRFVITDVRFENEADFIRRNGGQVVHLEGRKAGTGNDGHESERALARLEGDRVIANDRSIEAMHSSLDWMLA